MLCLLTEKNYYVTDCNVLRKGETPQTSYSNTYRRTFPNLLLARHQLVTGLVKDGWKQRKFVVQGLNIPPLVMKYRNTLNVARRSDKLFLQVTQHDTQNPLCGGGGIYEQLSFL